MWSVNLVFKREVKVLNLDDIRNARDTALSFTGNWRYKARGRAGEEQVRSNRQETGGTKRGHFLG